MENIISKELEENIKNAETLDAIATACAEEGISITKEQLEVAGNADDELNETALDHVTGGLSVIGGALAAAIIWGIYRTSRSSRGGRR